LCRQYNIYFCLHSALHIYIYMCADGLKPVVGMSFDSIKYVEQFYKSYAHKVRFSVRISPQHLFLDEVVSKKFLCSRQGFKKTNASVVEGHNHILVSPNKTQFL
jgi:hypothetical protein